MNTTLSVLHWLAGFIVLAEALNKLERVDPCARGITTHQRVVDSLKALAWLLLAIGAGGAVASPLLECMGVQAVQIDALLNHANPSIADASVMVGFAVLIVRTRVKEG